MYTEITTREVRHAQTHMDDTEKGYLVQCLKYCRHRITQHEESGINMARVPVRFIETLLGELILHNDQRGE